MLFFRLPEKNMNENKSLFKTFSSLARCCGRWRFFRALFMLLLVRLLLLLLLLVELLPLLRKTATTTTTMAATMLFFCCRWSDDDDGDDDQQEDGRDVVRRTSARLCCVCGVVGVLQQCVYRGAYCSAWKCCRVAAQLDEISSMCRSSPHLHGGPSSFAKPTWGIGFFASLRNCCYCHITHRFRIPRKHSPQETLNPVRTAPTLDQYTTSCVSQMARIRFQ